MTEKTNTLFEQCLADVDPETRAEVRKNMELTWQDIREIVEIADDIAVHEYANHPTGQEDYYTEILKRFKEFLEKKKAECPSLGGLLGERASGYEDGYKNCIEQIIREFFPTIKHNNEEGDE